MGGLQEEISYYLKKWVGLLEKFWGSGSGDVGVCIGYRSLGGTLSLYENAAVLTHQSTVRKDRRFH